MGRNGIEHNWKECSGVNKEVIEGNIYKVSKRLANHISILFTEITYNTDKFVNIWMYI